MTNEIALASRTFRDLIGRFATGVTVVTAQDGGQAQGMTANAVTSVSLDPMLLLVCVAKSASAHELMDRSTEFAVNILAEDQMALSAFFARPGHTDEPDPMGGFPHRAGPTGAPLLDGVMGWIECRRWQHYDGGDHTIVVGEVVEMEMARPDDAPLLFYAGGYHGLGASL